MFKTFRSAMFSAAMASSVVVPAYAHIQKPAIVATLSPASKHAWDEMKPYRNADGTVNLALILVPFLAPNSKYYGCLPDLGQVDDVLHPPTGSGVRMYFNSTTGSDANNGLTPATAKQTMSAFLSATNSTFGTPVAQGSAFYFQRGDSYINACTQIKNLAGSNYFIGCYGNPTLARPKFLYSNIDTPNAISLGAVFGIASNGSPVGPTVLQNLDLNGQQNVTVFYSGLSGGTPTVGDVVTCVRTSCTATLSKIPTSISSCIETQGFVLPGTGGASIGHAIQSGDTITGNTGWTATAGTVIAAGGFISNGALNITMQNCSVKNMGSNGVSPTGVATTTAANFTFRQLLIQDCQLTVKNGAGMGGGGGTNIFYDHISAITNGRDPVFSHNCYMVGAFGPSAITNCYSYGAANNGVTEHGGSDGLTISDNLFEANGNGLGMGPGFGTGGEEVDNGVITRNIVMTSGTRSPYTGAIFGSGVGISCWVNGKVTNNLIVGNTAVAITLQSDTSPGDAQNTNLQVYNNTVDGPNGSYGVYIKNHSGGTSHQVSLDIRNNIFSNATTSTFAILKDASETIPLASVTLNSNLYWMPNKVTSPTVGALIQWDGTNYTLAGFNTFDTTKEVSQLYQNPSYINPNATASGNNTGGRKFTGNYNQPIGSKLTGVALGVTTDFNNNVRAVQTIGAFR